MQVGLKIWRYDPASGERKLREYEIEAPEEATLLDCLDIVKDRHDGTLAYRKSCRMMICGSCGMRMDGAAVLACKTRMHEIAERASDGAPQADAEQILGGWIQIRDEQRFVEDEQGRRKPLQNVIGGRRTARAASRKRDVAGTG